MTIQIHGKPYAEVKDRVKACHEDHPECSITTEMLKFEDGICIIKATVSIPNKETRQALRVFTGHAYEKEGSSQINSTSYLENAETSAIGRALAAAGYGIDGSYASANEVQQAIKQQKEPSPLEGLAEKVGEQMKQDVRDHVASVQGMARAEGVIKGLEDVKQQKETTYEKVTEITNKAMAPEIAKRTLGVTIERATEILEGDDTVFGEQPEPLTSDLLTAQDWYDTLEKTPWKTVIQVREWAQSNKPAIKEASTDEQMKKFTDRFLNEVAKLERK